MLARIVIVLSVMVAVAITTDIRYLGCFEDGIRRDLNVSKHLGANATNETCFAFCKNLKYRYYALQAGEWCFCGQIVPRHRQRHQNDCNHKCKGNNKTTCGGKWRNQVYTTGIDSYITTRVGCFHDKIGRDLPHLHHLGKNSSRQACHIYCKGKKNKLFALQAGTWCACGDKHGKHGKTTDDKCTTVCAGEPTATCGGHWTNEVYATGL